MSLGKRISYVRNALLVRRYHQHPTHEIDTVGKHSAGVALFAQMIDPQCSKEVLLAALVHDLGEFITGDIPAPSKRNMSRDMRDVLDDMELEAIEEAGFDTELLSDDEVRLLKICDYCDGLSFCIEEVRRGNRAMVSVGDNYINYLPEYLGNMAPGVRWRETAQLTINYLVSEWGKANDKG